MFLKKLSAAEALERVSMVESLNNIGLKRFPQIDTFLIHLQQTTSENIVTKGEMYLKVHCII